ncbi:SDR family oxidoreductase [Microbacterium suaedae]|uniref:SDR family oxidoreductase n=1 Tax=Microbacterium suaedae TaxID=2067813 RepID=UPI000DA195F9|nr:SDR family oxidoreductase [Microbacterium suaedae]
MARTYVITGAGSGIGKTTAELLREQGHTVVGVDLKGAEVDADLSTVQGRADAVAAAIAAANGSVDAVIACAGISAPSALTASVNYFGMTEFLEGIRATLAESDAPRAALISSVSSVQPNFPPLVDALLSDDEEAALAVAEQITGDERTANLVYPSSKRAISRWVRREAPSEGWAGAGIPLNAVGPGIVTTPMTKDLIATPEGAAQVDAVVPMPLNYHQPPESVARLLIWLTSEQNTHMCGQTLYCDGGAEVELRGGDVWSAYDEAVNAKFAEIAGGMQG